MLRFRLRSSLFVRYTCDDRRLFGRGPYDILSGRYNLALPSTPPLNQQMEFDYDFKSTNTDLLSGGATIFPTTSELDQFSATYVTQFSDSQGITEPSATLVGSPGHLTPGNTQSALAQQQPGTSPTYAYTRIVLNLLTEITF